jgi:ribosomal protein S18 acetylase RimI-like enzyme
MRNRKAQEKDVSAMCAVDHIAQVEKERRQFIRHSVRDGLARVAVAGGRVVGYGVMDYSFFGRGFIAMLTVDPDHRRAGIGSALVRRIEGLCKSDRIFTSTNESNLPMQALLRKLGYKRSGIARDLDPGDPELFYSKHLRRQTTTPTSRRAPHRK